MNAVTLWKERSTTPDANAALQVVCITHPFHPLFGQSFELLTCRRTWGEDRVFFYEGDRLRGLPASWTDAVAPPAFVALAAGRAHFRPEDLLRLAALIDEVRKSRPVSLDMAREVLGPAGNMSRKLRRSCKDKNAGASGGERGTKKRNAHRSASESEGRRRNRTKVNRGPGIQGS